LIDEVTIEECRKGNLNGFRKVVDYSSPLVFSMALRMLGDVDDATEITQETMITVWQEFGKLKSPASFRTWLYRIAVNKCYDEFRKRKRNPEKLADEQGWKLLNDRLSENPGIIAENNELATVVVSLTEGLSPKQKVVFVLTDLEELSGEEVSRITGMTRFNVKSNLYYARKKIGEQIKRYM